MNRSGILLLFLLLPVMAHAQEWDLRGFAATEVRVFPAKPRFVGQDDDHLSPSIVIEPEISYEWEKRDDRIVFIPFGRLDAHDANRSHFDIRELSYLHLSDSWSLFVGAGKVFWGVAESRHLVDIINQDDRVEDIDGEDKLGQPMLNLTFEGEWGALDLFYLPYFRERTFPEDDARLRGPFPISDDPLYESGAEEWHSDGAVRWSNTIEDFDIGLSFFYGTGREPTFIPVTESGRSVLVPFYATIDQTGLDAQWTKDAWLLKLEAITRGGQGNRFVATVTGFEYTLFQIFESASDLGLLAEYLYDGRDDIDAPPTIFDNDLFLGTRYAFNNVADTDILAGTTVDLQNGELFAILEASHRVGENWLAEFELRYGINGERNSTLYAFEKDSFFTLRLSRFI